MNPPSFYIFLFLLFFASTKVLGSEPYEAALKAFSAEEYSEAEIHLKNSLQANPRHLPSKIMLGRILIVNGNFGVAIIELKEALKMGADIEVVLEPLGEALLFSGDTKAVLSVGDGYALSKTAQMVRHLLRGSAFTKLKQLDDALKEYQLALQLAPSNTKALNSLAGFYYRVGQIEHAKKLVRKSMSLDSNNFRTWHLQGHLYRTEKDIRNAVAAFEKALVINPKDTVSRRALARIYLEIGHTQQASLMVDRILKDKPTDPIASLLKARLLLLAEETALSKQVLNDLNQRLSRVPEEKLEEHSWVLFISGVSAYLAGRYESAAPDLVKYLHAEPDNFNAIAILANTYVKLGEQNLAMSLLEKHEQKVIEDLDVALMLCDFYISYNKHLQFDQLISKLEARYPLSPEILISKARNLVKKGNNVAALQILETSYQELRNPVISAYLPKLYLMTGQPNKALGFTNYLLQTNPDNFDLQNLKGGALIELGKYKEAHKILQSLLERDPKHFAARYNMASLQLEAGQPQVSRSLSKKLLREDPYHSDSMLLLVRAEIALGNSTNAIQQLEELMKIDARNTRAAEMLIGLLKLTGEYERALVILEGLAEYDRLNPGYLLEKAELHMAMGQFASAQKQLNILYGFWLKKPDQLIKLSHLQRRARDLKGARSSMDQAIQLRPESQNILFADAELNIYERDFKSAKRKIASLKKRWPDSPGIVELEGDFLLADKQPEMAQKSYATAFHLDKKNGFALVKFYNLALKGYEETLFEQTLINAVAEYPNNHYYRSLLADYFLLKQRFDEAKHHYLVLKDVKGLPNTADILNNLALTYLEDDLNSAHKYARQAVQINSSSASILDTYGWVLAHQENYKNALNILRQAQVKSANDPSIRFHLGYTLHQLGRTVEAVREIEFAVNSSIDFLDKNEAKRLLATLQ